MGGYHLNANGLRTWGVDDPYMR
ncbi:hypothetical protein CCACVL1_02952 [Corchorus capsularis]|uniref:Uncharacterized protein n=1 Tax=Corchorus capsularis TaxID=210143 RepID=A0A1R3K4K6_COCAP|nr:hypothetical protein CCACVL1_02952 [Corchorus capsularis]